MFDSLSAKLTGAFSSLRSRGKISTSDIENTCADIRSALLESDVALSVVDSFIDVIREKSLAALPNIQSGTNQALPGFFWVGSGLVPGGWVVSRMAPVHRPEGSIWGS
jgi:signal recognition particle subunit SRP54